MPARTPRTALRRLSRAVDLALVAALLCVFA